MTKESLIAILLAFSAIFIFFIFNKLHNDDNMIKSSNEVYFTWPNTTSNDSI